MREVFLLVGSPGSGKTWVMDQLHQAFDVVEHDDYKTSPGAYAKLLIDRAESSTKPVLGNTPFGVSEIMGNLSGHRVKCTAIFIIEFPSVLGERYMRRENKPIPKGHLTRQETYKLRAKELGSFWGTSAQVLAHLRSLVNPDK